MKQTKLTIIGLFFATGLLMTSCGTKEEKRAPIYSSFTELEDPDRNPQDVWTDSSKGFNASFVSTDLKFAKSSEPKIGKAEMTDQLTGWKGEKVFAEILVWSKEDLKNIEYHVTDLKSSNGTISKTAIEPAFVRYVMTDEFAGGCGYRKPEDFVARLSQDMLDPITTMDLEAQTVRPIWFTISIPRDAAAGNYKTTITISADGQKSKEFKLELDVQNATLPTAQEWDYHLDLWQHPSAVARTENLEMWSDAHFEALKAPMKMLADAGQKVITATLNKDPWNNQCYDPYAEMITWTKHKDGTWSYNYEVFDRWVNFMMDLGINKMINCYSVVPWNNELIYLDEATGEVITVQANPGSKEFKEIWHEFFKSFNAHLTEKGWLDITNIAMDERTPKEMEATIKMLQEEAPDLGISYADNQKSYKRYPFVKDISIEAGATIDPADLKDRQTRGLTTTYYVCCSDAFPNMFTFSGPAESVYAGWYALAMNYDGFLRWAYNSWVEDPVRDSRFRTWPAGDTYIIYPEAKSSIRFERLIEGIQDLEKVKILRKELAKENSIEANDMLIKLNNTVDQFATIKPEKDYTKMLEEAKNVVNEATNFVYNNKK